MKKIENLYQKCEILEIEGCRRGNRRKGDTLDPISALYNMM